MSKTKTDWHWHGTVLKPDEFHFLQNGEERILTATVGLKPEHAELIALALNQHERFIELEKRVLILKTILESALTFPHDDMHPLVRQKITHCVTQIGKLIPAPVTKDGSE